MEYTHLSEFDIRPGALTLWTPESESAAWRPDARPLTSAHDRYCAATDPAETRPGRGRWIGTIFEMDAALDADAWRETLRRWHIRHEGLRSTVDAARRRWVLGPDAVGIAAQPVTGLTDGMAINTFLTEVLETQLSPLAWPHLLAATVEHRDTGDFTVLIGADHSVLDAYSQAILILELRALYRDVRDGIAPREAATFGSAADFAATEHAASGALTGDCPGVALWREFLGPDRSLPRFAPALSIAGADTPVQPSLSRHLLGLAELEAVEAVLDGRRQRLSVAVFAALALAYQRTFGADRMRTVMPVATRPDLRWLESMGWFVNVVPVDIAADPRAGTAAALEPARAALRRARAADTTSWCRALELLGVAETPTFGISFLDIRVLPNYEVVEQLRGRTLRAESYSPDEVYFWVVRAADGLRVSTRYPAALPAATMDAFLAAFTHAMTELAAPAAPAVADEFASAVSRSVAASLGADRGAGVARRVAEVG
ncbi:condensation domain-containing protein [Nocardia thailandica]